jgi:hypothetical protein
LVVTLESRLTASCVLFLAGTKRGDEGESNEERERYEEAEVDEEDDDDQVIVNVDEGELGEEFAMDDITEGM